MVGRFGSMYDVAMDFVSWVIIFIVEELMDMEHFVRVGNNEDRNCYDK